eukprot:2070855-Amphidinium_carterae.2
MHSLSYLACLTLEAAHSYYWADACGVIVTAIAPSGVVMGVKASPPIWQTQPKCTCQDLRNDN